MKQADINSLKIDLTNVANGATNAIRRLDHILETEKPVTTNEASCSMTLTRTAYISDKLNPEEPTICCKAGTTTYNFSPEQYNHIVVMMGGSYRDVKGKVIEKLIKDGECLVDRRDAIHAEEILEHIKIEPTPGSVGCYTYTFDLTSFLASDYFQNTLKECLHHLNKTVNESTMQFNELSLLKKS